MSRWEAISLEPENPFQGRFLDILETPPSAAAPNAFRLGEPDHGIHHGVVSALAPAADGGLDARLGQSLHVANIEVRPASLEVTPVPGPLIP